MKQLESFQCIAKALFGPQLLRTFELIAALRHVNISSHEGMTGSMNGSSSRAS